MNQKKIIAISTILLTIASIIAIGFYLWHDSDKVLDDTPEIKIELYDKQLPEFDAHEDINLK